MVKKKTGIAIIACLFNFFVLGQHLTNHSELISIVDSLFLKGVEHAMIPAGSITIVTSDSVLLCRAYGFADVNEKIPATDSTLFQVGSLGKLFTSIAVLQLVENGLLNLDEDVNNYLVDWKIKNPFSKPVTLRHLLTHSAGFNERVIGYQARTNKDVEPLGKHLQRRMPSLFQAPGTEINYSNYGYALAGYIVELKSGIFYEQYVRDRILKPLEIQTSTFFLPDDYEQNNRYAKGYRTTKDGFTFLKNYPRNTPPAGGILMTAKDMVPFLQMFLKKKLVLSEKSFDVLLEPQFKVHPMLTGYSFSFEEQLYNGHQFFTKAGQVQGALALVWILPDLDLAIYYSVNTQTDNFFTTLGRKLKTELFGESKSSGEVIKNFDPTDPKHLKGVYRSNRYNRETIEDFISLFMNPVEISVSKNGKVTTNLHGVFQQFEEIDKGVFQGVKDPNVKVTFSENKGSYSMYTDYVVAGVTLPASFEKVPFYETPSFVDSGYPTIWIPIMIYPLVLLWLGIIWVVRTKKHDFLKGKTLTFSDHWPLLLFFFLVIVDASFFLVPLLKNPNQLLFGLPSKMANMKFLHLFMVLNLMAVVYFNYRIWKDKYGSWFSRIYYTLFAFSATFYIYFLNRWHFISMNY